MPPPPKSPTSSEASAEPASRRIDRRILDLEGWRGKTLARMRALILEQQFRADLMVAAFALNAAYFAVAIVIFLALLRSARRIGSLLQSGE